MNTNPTYLPVSSGTTPTNSKLRNFFQQHQLLLIAGFIGLITIIAAIFIIIFTQPRQQPEKAPYITFNSESILTNDLQPAFSDDLLFNLKLIMLNESELNSLPISNYSERERIVTFDTTSFKQNPVTSIQNGELYTVNLNVSDGRTYLLRVLMCNQYLNEYAVAILNRTDNISHQSYIVSFTNYTDEYYNTIGTERLESLRNSSEPSDHITGFPINPLPQAASIWLNSLNLTDPKTIHAVLPVFR